MPLDSYVTGYKQKVWSRSFICQEALECPNTNKQYPTLVQYEVGTERADYAYKYKI